MSRASDKAVCSSVMLQVGFVLLAFIVLALLPPATGRMLILPLSASAGRQAAALAVGGGARLMGAGPVAGSLIVWGDRDRLLTRVTHSGALLLAAPPGACGETLEPAR